MKINQIIHHFILGLLFILGIVGFFHFEYAWFYKIAIISMVFIGLLWFLGQGKLDFTIYLVFALLIYNLDNLNLISGWKLFLIISIIALINSYLFYLMLFFDYERAVSMGLLLFYMALFDLFIVEIFLSLSYWPANPISKSIILVSLFYLFYQVAYLRFQNMLQLKKIYPHILVSMVAIILIISSAQWYGL